MKFYLVQTKYPDGETTTALKTARQIINNFYSRDRAGTEYEVYDVSEYGKVVKLEYQPAISAPKNNPRFVNPESGEVVFEGYSPEH